MLWRRRERTVPLCTAAWTVVVVTIQGAKMDVRVRCVRVGYLATARRARRRVTRTVKLRFRELNPGLALCRYSVLIRPGAAASDDDFDRADGVEDYLFRVRHVVIID